MSKINQILKRGKLIEESDASKIDYEFTSPDQFFNETIALIPIKNAVPAQRIFYGEKLYSQSVPLVHREAPYVQAQKDGNISFEEFLGKKSGGVVMSDKDDDGSVVESVTDDEIKYRTPDGKIKSKDLYHNHAFNRKTRITNIPQVKVGDKISANQVLASSNYTDKDGSMAMGVNARIAMVPYKGWSLDDSTVISESFAKKLTSDHMYIIRENDDKNLETNKTTFLNLFKDKFTKDQTDKLTDDGVPKVGAVLNYGDPVILSVKPKIISSKENYLGRLSKFLNGTKSDASIIWDHENPGIVTDVVKSKNGWKVNVSTESPANVGDKLSLRAGQKCYHPDTEVCTESGWKFISEISSDDKVEVLFRNKSTGKFYKKLLKPKSLISYEYDGDLYCYESSLAAYAVTADHMVWYAEAIDNELIWKKDEASKLHGRNDIYFLFKLGAKREKGDHNWSKLFEMHAVEPSCSGSFTKIPYKGMVYCCEVSGLGVLHTRLHGKEMWNGNCTISKIIPDDKMPRTLDGKPVDVLFNQLGLNSRTNASSAYEILLGKVAEKTGKKYILPSFNKSDEKWYEFVENELKNAGIPDTEYLYDPESDRTLKNPVMVGNAYILKLHHMSEGKMTARNQGIYDLNMLPLKGGDEGAKSKRLSGLAMYGLLSAGAYNDIRDALHIRGQRNDDYWRQVRMGLTPTLQKQTPFIWDKYLAILRGAGFNVTDTKDKNGDTILQLSPLSDRQFEKTFKPDELENAEIVDFDNMKPVDGGLFSPDKIISNKWSKITLDRPYPNPPFENVIASLLYIKKSDIEDIMSGKKELKDFGTGGQALKKALANIDTEQLLSESKKTFKSGPKSLKDKALNRIKYIHGLRENNMTPDELMIQTVPVLPPSFRPYTIMGDTFIAGDANELYKDLFNVNKIQKSITKTLGKSDADANSINVYNALKALYGYDDSKNIKLSSRNVSGFLSKLIGDTSKFSIINRMINSKPMDFTGGGVISPNPELGMDEAMLPEDMAFKLFAPKIQNELSKMGYNLTDSIQAIKDKSDVARLALNKVLETTPIILNREPSWHKFNTIGAWAKTHPGKSIYINPLVTSGIGGDFDGDCQNAFIYVKTQNEGLPDDSVKIYITDMSSFPRTDFIKTINGKNGPIDFYNVPEGTCVPALDEASNKVVWADVAFWTVHKDRRLEIVTLKNGSQIFTDDDERAIYGINPDNGKFERHTPTEALNLGILVPVCEDLIEYKNLNSEFIDSDYRLKDCKSLREIRQIQLEYKSNGIKSIIEFDKTKDRYVLKDGSMYNESPVDGFIAIDHIDYTLKKETGYDLSVPGYETFINSDGIVLSNTMTVQVPASQKAIEDVKEKLMPSKQVISVRNISNVINPLKQDYILGLFNSAYQGVGESPNVKTVKVNNLNEALDLIRSGKIDFSDYVEI